MAQQYTQYDDAISFADMMKKIKRPSALSIGKFLLPLQKGVSNAIQYNRAGVDLMGDRHEYTIPILDGNLQMSLQLYLNVNKHYRLFCYTLINGCLGMTFSLNLTTEKESEDTIYLTQKIKFVEQYQGSLKLAQAHRRQKQIVFCELLQRLGYDITDNNELILGIFDPSKGRLVNTSKEVFLNDFIVVSLLKGHFQGNKGYQLEIMPTYNNLDYIFTGKDDVLEMLPVKVAASKAKRSIPLGMRYKVLKKDNFRCVACGHSALDGVKLHIDHRVPYSLGGMTDMNNLQTLCSDCNISKSNKFQC